jgi:hypothetical protein
MTGVIWRRDIPHGRCGMPPSASFAFVGTRAKSVFSGIMQLRCSRSRSSAYTIQRPTCDELNLVRNTHSRGLCAFVGTAMHRWKTAPMKTVTTSNCADSYFFQHRLSFHSLQYRLSHSLSFFGVTQHVHGSSSTCCLAPMGTLLHFCEICECQDGSHLGLGAKNSTALIAVDST